MDWHNPSRAKSGERMKSIYRNGEGYKDPTGGMAIINTDRKAAKTREVIKAAEDKRELCRMLINSVRYAAGVPALPVVQVKRKRGKL